MTSIIFVMRPLEKTIRAGMSSRRMVGPMMKPMRRSVLIHRAPAKTWKKSSPYPEFLAIVTTSATRTAASTAMPHNGTNGPAWALGAATAA